MEILFDDDYKTVVGPKLIADVQAAIQPSGDCQTCGLLLGEQQVRVGFVHDDSHGAFLARHRACGPTSTITSNVRLFSPATFLYVNALARATAGPSMVVTLYNPCTDRIDIHHDGTSWVGPMEHFAAKGFTPLAETTSTINPAAARLNVDEHTVLIDNNVCQLEPDPAMQQAVRDNGLIVVVSMRLRTDDLRLETMMMSLSADPDLGLVGIVPPP